MDCEVQADHGARLRKSLDRAISLLQGPRGLSALAEDSELWSTLADLARSDQALQADLLGLQSLLKACSRPEEKVEKCGQCNGLGEWVTPVSRYGAPTRCRLCGGSGYVRAR